jgi:hypothetical protein
LPLKGFFIGDLYAISLTTLFTGRGDLGFGGIGKGFDTFFSYGLFLEGGGFIIYI